MNISVTTLAWSKMQRLHMTIIKIRPFRNGWQVFESAGVEPVFLSQEQAIDYAKGRVWFRSGKIRILDSSGVTARVIPLVRQIEDCDATTLVAITLSGCKTGLRVVS